MKFGVCVPNLGEFADPHGFGELAHQAEQAGWDGVFVWDHVVFAFGDLDTADPWTLLTVAATRTRSIQLGPLVTAVARRRPSTLARQTTTLDRLSGGRLVFGAGLGFTLDAEFGTWGEPVDPRTVSERLDEGLTVLSALWSGDPVDFHGRHLTATNVVFRPTPVRQPRPPVWVGCNWPSRAPLRRAAWWDGVAPMIVDPADGSWAPTASIVAEIVSVVGAHRGGVEGYDVVITGRSPEEAAQARGVVEPIAEAGATWWLEGFRPAPGEWDAALRRIEAGPPA